MTLYDWLIVGAGLFGSVFAHEVTARGKTCLVVDRRNHIGGNIFCESIEGINVHKYGAHIFHTNDKSVWDFMNQFADFNRYTNSPVANFKGEIYNLPFNMNTFNRLWGTITPDDARRIIDAQRDGINEPKNLEEQAISLVGTDIYEKLIKGYTEKQWGRKCTELPPFIIKRLPVRFTYDNNYFNDRYQGIPIGGYNQIAEKLLRGCDVRLNTDFLNNRDELSAMAAKILYTGMIDEYYGYCFGNLEYRSLRFETELLETQNYQGNAVVNYTDSETPFTRIIEHKHFEFGEQQKTVITREYPLEWNRGDEPYYPVNDNDNTEKYSKYEALAKKETIIIFGGRLGSYRYSDMWQIVKESRELAIASII